MGQSRASHVLLERAVVVDSEVTLARLSMIGAVNALHQAVAEDPAVLLLVGAFGGVFLGGVVGDSADMAADVVGGAAAFLHHVGENVAAGALFERGELAREAHS